MKFELDTKQLEQIKLIITEDDREKGLQGVIEEFCYSLSCFFVDFAMKLDLNEEQARSLKNTCISCIDNYTDEILNQGVLDNTEDMTNEELEELIQQLIDSGFTEEEIEHITEIVKMCGSIEAATDYLSDFIPEE